MVRQRFVIALAVLAAVAAGGFGTFHQSAAAGPVAKYVFSPKPIAPAGTLALGASAISVTVTAEDSTGAAVPNASVNLSFSSLGLQPSGATGGSAKVGSVALTSTPAPFAANGSGVIPVTYTPPQSGTLPTSGRDQIAASDPTTPTITGSDAYSFSAVTAFTWNPQPIAATGSLAAGDSVTFQVIARDGGGNAVPNATVFLSFTGAGSATAMDNNPAVTKTLTSTPKTFIADSNGAVSITYHAPSSLPSSGTDTVTAQNQGGTTPAFKSTDTYSFSGTGTPSFLPKHVGAPQVAVTPDGSTQLVFWKDTTNSLLSEAWYAGGSWHGPINFPQLGALTSTPAVAVTKDGSTQLVFWQGSGGHLFEAWYTGTWNGPLDVTSSQLQGQGILASSPSIVTTTDGSQLIFWRGGDGHLNEAWYSNGWHGPVDFTSLGTLASAPSATVTPDGSTQLVFFQGTDNHLAEDWYAGGSWHGPVDWTGLGTLASSPSVAVTPDGSTQIVFSRTAAGHLQEAWYAGGSWHGPADFTATSFGGQGLLTSAPSATVTTDGSTQIVFWQGSGNTLWEGWYAGGHWNGPVNFSG
ncbi:MAG: hypothetical protein M3019_03390 [Candidatus Dormibacteraeota bacterium]|nr:hypothetical protein [Candidatus Dormibacteraeota bacterium]